MTKTKLSSFNIIITNLLDDLAEVGSDTSEHFDNCLVVASSDTSGLEDLLTKFWVRDTEGKLLFFARFSLGQLA